MITKPKIYTRDFVLKEVTDILNEIREDKDIFFLGQVFEKKNYSIKRYSEWRKEYSKDEEISETIEKISDTLESRVVTGAMKKSLHVTMAIFHLKNNFKWTDKVEINQKGGHPLPILWNPDGTSILEEIQKKELLGLL